jgi:hypothetical protein
LTLAKKKLAEQAHKAWYALYSKTRNFNIPIDRWTSTPCIERTCVLYNNRSIGDELHYLFLCQNEQIQRLRVTCIPSYYFTNTCQNNLNGIWSICSKPVLNNVAIFIEKIRNFYNTMKMIRNAPNVKNNPCDR